VARGQWACRVHGELQSRSGVTGIGQASRFAGKWLRKLRQPACQSAARSGQSEERIQNIVVWWEANCFDEREKAALAWTGSVTFVAETHVPDDVYE
jgi:hypothetical protein